MTRFETRAAAITAAQDVLVARGFTDGNGYIIDSVPGYHDGKKYREGYYKAYCRVAKGDSNATLI